jgi:hypothetical protein
MAYNSNYLPAMLYSLMAMNIDEDELYEVQKRALFKFLQLTGFEGRFPRAAVFASVRQGGLGMRQLYVESLCSKIECVISHLNSNSSLGKNMKINLIWIQLITGIEKPLFESTHSLKYVIKNWFTHIRTFLLKIKAKIIIQGTWKPDKLQIDDWFLMDELERYDWTDREWIIFNNWRLFFKVLTLSHITNHTGNRILPQFLNRRQVNEWQSNSKYTWPHQERPPLETFKIWKRMLVRITGCDSVGNLTLRKLGSWYQTFQQSIRVKSRIHISTKKLLVWCEGSVDWKCYHQVHENWSFYCFNKDHWDYEDYPVDYTEDRATYFVYIRGLSNMVATITQQPQPNVTNFHNYLRTSEFWSKPLMHTFQASVDFSTGLHSGDELVLCSDGGLRDNNAGFRVVLSLNGSMVANTRMRIIPEYSPFTSYRTESYGML